MNGNTVIPITSMTITLVALNETPYKSQSQSKLTHNKQPTKIMKHLVPTGSRAWGTVHWESILKHLAPTKSQV